MGRSVGHAPFFVTPRTSRRSITNIKLGSRLLPLSLPLTLFPRRPLLLHLPPQLLSLHPLATMSVSRRSTGNWYGEDESLPEKFVSPEMMIPVEDVELFFAVVGNNLYCPAGGLLNLVLRNNLW